jgi:hypothetical protein
MLPPKPGVPITHPRPAGRSRQSNRHLLIAGGLLGALLAVSVLVAAIMVARPKAAGRDVTGLSLATGPVLAVSPHPQASPSPGESPRVKSREEWLVELEARTLKATPALSPEAGRTPTLKTEEQAQIEQAHAIYEAILGGVAPEMKRLSALRDRYDEICTGVTITRHVTEGTEARGWTDQTEVVVDGRGHITGTVDRPARTRLWIPPRETTSTTPNSQAPECRAILLDANELASKIGKATSVADEVAVAKGVWTLVRATVKDQVIASLNR